MLTLLHPDADKGAGNWWGIVFGDAAEFVDGDGSGEALPEFNPEADDD